MTKGERNNKITESLRRLAERHGKSQRDARDYLISIGLYDRNGNFVWPNVTLDKDA